MFKSLLTIFLFFNILSFPLFAQLDSIYVSATFNYETALNFEGDSLPRKMVTVETWVNDFDFLGVIIITIYDQEANYPVDKQKFTKQQISDLNMLNNGVITTKSYTIEENRSYRIEAIVSNDHGLYLDTVIAILMID